MPDGLLAQRFGAHNGEPGVSALLGVEALSLTARDALTRPLISGHGDPLWFSIGSSPSFDELIGP